jgi:hypothetical protein
VSLGISGLSSALFAARIWLDFSSDNLVDNFPLIFGKKQQFLGRQE